jgi:hypothetical protein
LFFGAAEPIIATLQQQRIHHHHQPRKPPPQETPFQQEEHQNSRCSQREKGFRGVRSGGFDFKHSALLDAPLNGDTTTATNQRVRTLPPQNKTSALRQSASAPPLQLDPPPEGHGSGGRHFRNAPPPSKAPFTMNNTMGAANHSLSPKQEPDHLSKSGKFARSGDIRTLARQEMEQSKLKREEPTLSSVHNATGHLNYKSALPSPRQDFKIPVAHRKKTVMRGGEIQDALSSPRPPGLQYSPGGMRHNDLSSPAVQHGTLVTTIAMRIIDFPFYAYTVPFIFFFPSFFIRTRLREVLNSIILSGPIKLSTAKVQLETSSLKSSYLNYLIFNSYINIKKMYQT